jgi:hypothetical protein
MRHMCQLAALQVSIHYDLISYCYLESAIVKSFPHIVQLRASDYDLKEALRRSYCINQ